MIHALPGLGADHRMYPPVWQKLPGFKAYDWPRYGGETTIADVAAALAEHCRIRDGDGAVGSSLGGMVACEISKIRRLDSLFLLGSATRPEEVGRLLGALHPLVHVAQIDWLRLSAASIPHEFARMFSGIEATFVRAMCDAIFKWRGLGETATPVFRVHGKHDHVIPPPARVDLLLDGGHLISMSHADECVAFIKGKRRGRGCRSTGK